MALLFTSPSALTIAAAANGQTLAAGNTSVSGVIDLSALTDNTVDVEVQMTFGASFSATPTATTGVNVFVVGSNDGTNWPDGVTPGGLATPNATTGSSYRFLAYVPPPSTATGAQTLRSQPLSIAAAFGGVLPRFLAIVFTNNTGAALTSASGNFVRAYYT